MKINRLFLRNIRSYIEQELHFPNGSILLSGNIGSGKSTVLLAIDFALFGLQRGNLTGAALLRNGADSGEVELDFEVNEKKVTIKRSLKRSKDNVVQNSGKIVIDGEIQEATAIELKQKVLELFNYPKDLLTKNKALIFRYTVYTPQEEMKQILLGDKKDRLETLRKVFGIDKYKRVQENTKIIISNIKLKKKELKGISSDLPLKQEQIKAKELELKQMQEQLNKFVPRIEFQKKIVEEKRSNIQIIEEQIKQLTNFKKELEITELKRTHKLNEVEKIIKDIGKIKKEIQELETENLEGNTETIKAMIEESKNKVTQSEIKIKQLENQIQEIKTKIQISNNIKEKFLQLNICPTCQQEIKQEYKDRIILKETETVNKLAQDLEEVKQSEIIEQQMKSKMQEELEILKRREQEITLKQFKKKALEEKKLTKQRLNNEKSKINTELVTLNISKTQLEKNISELKEVESQYKQQKIIIEQEENSLKLIELEQAKCQAQIKPIQDFIETLHKEIQNKLKAKNSLAYLTQMQQWLEEHFINLLGEMEKSIMYKVHSNFNDLFQKWFNVLMDNPTLQISLDEEFSPKIEQDGYDIEYSFLSGGEKTAAALAYRLALNQVINNTMTTINTNDLLILDEPTDGFSNAQLDRLRIILEELKLNQVIIVSHEDKIESFVNSVMKFDKKEHISRVS